MPDLKNQALLAYIKYVLDAMELTPPQLARKAGISPSTITRFLNSDSYKFNPSSSTIDKIFQASGINPAPFYAAESPSDRAMMHFVHDDLFDKRWDTKDLERHKKMGSVVIMGDAEAGRWQDVKLFAQHSHGSIPMTFANFKAGEIFALLIKGGSVNRLAEPNDYIVFSKFHTRESFKDGEFVAVERYINGSDLKETTVRLISADRETGRWTLAFASNDERFGEKVDLGLIASELIPSREIEKSGFAVLGSALFVWRLAALNR